jgi:hypothetical protein
LSNTHYYAHIENDVVVGTSRLSGEVSRVDYQPITEEQANALHGYSYIDGEFIAPVVTPRNKLVITGITDGTDAINLDPSGEYELLTILAGTSTTITVEMRDHEDNLLPAEEDFVLPISGLGGALSRSLLVQFENGVATRTVAWPQSGIWQVTETEVNADIDGAGFEFSPLKIKVFE